MRNHRETLEIVANDLIEQQATLDNSKPNYSNQDFMNAVFIFMTALMDKMYDLQQSESIALEHRYEMTASAGEQLRQLIKTFTGIDTQTVGDK